MHQNHDVFKASEDPAAKTEPILAWLEHLWQISIQKTEVWDEGGHPGLSWRRYVGRKTATRPDIGKELVRELEKLRDHCNMVIQLGGDYPPDI